MGIKTKITAEGFNDSEARYDMFAIRRQGECCAGEETPLTYRRKGASTSCIDGLGSRTDNSVYRVTPSGRRISDEGSVERRKEARELRAHTVEGARLGCSGAVGEEGRVLLGERLGRRRVAPLGHMPLRGLAVGGMVGGEVGVRVEARLAVHAGSEAGEARERVEELSRWCAQDPLGAQEEELGASEESQRR